ncbi:MAG: hypothetical protein AAFV53_06015 [Myxococcota bacterium]
MPWRIVKRRLGRAGGFKERTARQRQWDRQYGDGAWEIGYAIDGGFISQQDAIASIYNASYEAHFEQHPEDLDELVALARTLRNPHARATSGVDLQIPAIRACLARRGLRLQGTDVVDIGAWKNQASHPISIRLSPLQIKVIGDPKMTLEKFWQSKKCLAVWEED